MTLPDHDLAVESSRKTSGSLTPGTKHPWGKNEYTKLTFSWAGVVGTGTCSVKLGDRATSYPPPQNNLPIANSGGSLTNNTDKTINYTLE